MAASAAGLLLSIFTAGAQTQLTVTNSFKSINKPIPDGNANGIVDIRTVTSSEISQITDVKVGLKISGGFNGDLYCYLVHENERVVLLNRPGVACEMPLGYDEAGYNIMFSADAAEDVQFYRHVTGNGTVVGVFKPDARDCDPLVCSQDSPRSKGLKSFAGLNPNGKWTLFVADLSSGATATLTEWSVIITGSSDDLQLAARN